MHFPCVKYEGTSTEVFAWIGLAIGLGGLVAGVRLLQSLRSGYDGALARAPRQARLLGGVLGVACAILVLYVVTGFLVFDARC